MNREMAGLAILAGIARSSPEASTMRYLIAFLCPLVAILMCGRVFLFLVSIPLCFFYFPAALLALLVVAAYYEEHRYDAMMRESIRIERSYMKIWKSHMKAVNRGLDEEAKMARFRRKQAQRAAKGQRAQPAIARPPRRPLITMEGIKSIGPMAKSLGSMAKEMVLLARDNAMGAYRGLPDWAQPISWGLAAGSSLSILVLLVLIVRR